MNSPVVHDPATAARAMQLCQMMDEFIANQTPQERDRTMQFHLAQARGPVLNGDFLRAGVARAARTMAAREGRDVAVDDPLIDTLSTITRALERLRIPHAIAGSLAASIHGEPISSQEVELLIDASPEDECALLSELYPRFTVSIGYATDQHGSLCFKDTCTSLKISLSLVHDDSFLRSCVARRQAISIGSDTNEFCILRLEDVILNDFKTHRETQSTKHWGCALGLAKFKEARMDWRHLFEQARVSGLEDHLIRLHDKAGI